jgi:alkanesulfonate monooxygenase SsuD/methylene tetrahydromethanopterin reductase-like flavin-dependent oxidoreductase (luciferase family)
MVLETGQDPLLGRTPRWTDIQRQAGAAEEAGFDTVWIADELQWESEEWKEPLGFWECAATAGAVAASTKTISVGTWVLSALHRNPGLTARIAETLHEISGGRFLFGLGSGHAGRQGEAFGFPAQYTVSRYEEALAIITALRRDGRASFDGRFHSARDLVMTPRPDGSPNIPLLLGGHKPRTMRLACEHADIWSAFVTSSSQPEAFRDVFQQFEEVCEETGRDPASMGKSIGIVVAPPDKQPVGILADYEPIRGSLEQITDAFGRFADMGSTRLEIMAAGDQDETIESLEPAVAAFASEPGR